MRSVTIDQIVWVVDRVCDIGYDYPQLCDHTVLHFVTAASMNKGHGISQAWHYTLCTIVYIH